VILSLIVISVIGQFGDINNDGCVDLRDFAVLQRDFDGPACLVQGPCFTEADCHPDACETVICVNGVCISSPLDCEDDDPCTIDSCNPSEGCFNIPVLCEPGFQCLENRGNCVPIFCQTNANCPEELLCVFGVCQVAPAKVQPHAGATDTNGYVKGRCVGGPNAGKPCEGDADCAPGTCKLIPQDGKEPYDKSDKSTGMPPLKKKATDPLQDNCTCECSKLDESAAAQVDPCDATNNKKINQDNPTGEKRCKQWAYQTKVTCKDGGKLVDIHWSKTSGAAARDGGSADRRWCDDNGTNDLVGREPFSCKREESKSTLCAPMCSDGTYTICATPIFKCQDGKTYSGKPCCKDVKRKL